MKYEETMIVQQRLLEYLNKHHPGSVRKIFAMLRYLRVPLYFALWYALNIFYNITNKWALEDVHQLVSTAESNGGLSYSPGTSSSLPITMGCVQFAVGSMYACTLWVIGMRSVPHAHEVKSVTECIKKLLFLRRSDGHEYSSITGSNHHVSHPRLRDTAHIAIYHTSGQLCTVLSLSLNSIGFAHVIKAMEPFFSAIASRIFFGKRMDIRVYLALIPVVGGVVMAVAGSDEFSWLAFWFGMGSNVFFALRAVVSKLAMQQPTFRDKEETSLVETFEDNPVHDDAVKAARDTAMSPSNLFAAVTCVSFFFSIPLVIIFEGRILVDLLKFLAINSNHTEGRDLNKTIMYILSSGLFHYINNEVMYLVLSSVHPITLAVGNTLKRVFIIISGVIVFSTPVTWQTAIGSTIGIGGVLLYSLMMQWYDSGSHHVENSHSDSKMIISGDVELITELTEHVSDDQQLVSRKHISSTTTAEIKSPP